MKPRYFRTSLLCFSFCCCCFVFLTLLTVSMKLGNYILFYTGKRFPNLEAFF